MATAVRAPSGRKIWKAVRDELMLNLYPLPFSTIAPTVYHVYLHPDDFDAIDGVAARVVGADPAGADGGSREGQPRAPAVHPPRLERACWTAKSCRRSRSRAGGWEVHVCADRNGELERGQLGIVSTLAMPAPA